MDLKSLGAVDCDIHPALQNTDVLLPYLDDYWREMVQMRSVADLELFSNAAAMPIGGRADWRPAKGKPGTDFALLREQALDGFGLRFAICNVLYGAPYLANEDFSTVLTRAINDWVAAEWLARDPRLRASIVIPTENVDASVAEIERLAPDRRFVQVLVLAAGERLLGKRSFWPIYAAAQRHGLPIGIHAGSSRRHAPSSLGWGSFHFEDYVGHAQAFQAQLLSLVSEGVFAEYPELKVVLIESGFTWLPAFLWRFDKTWRGLRHETPWVKRPPTEIVRDHVRMTLQPVDGPPDPAQFEQFLDHLGSDEMLLFSTDYPHWQFDPGNEVPAALSADQLRRIAVDNPLRTYSRLQEA
ncbi:amidohydrolase family protein [Roseomonas sp. BN140053]|uniref:amidohydrolase family protein n=1 Tax=Roseomonas sp. BN140053 TaxID=3391898 RepID=UPI0039E8EA95